MASVIGYNSLLVSQLQREKNPDLVFTFELASWISSLWAIASVAGCLLGSILSDLLGRRKALMVSILPFLLSYFLMFIATNRTTILISRAIAGFGDGLLYPVIPVYVAETASKGLRSSMNNVTNISQNVGYVLLYMFSLHLTWRPLAALLLAFPAIAMACLLPLPETPYWLARQGRLEEARQSLAWLREGEQYLEEEHEILEVCTGQADSGVGMLKGLRLRAGLLLTKRFLHPMMIAGPLFLMYACSGFSLIGFYLVTVLEEANVAIPPLQASLLLVIWRLLLSVLSSYLLLRTKRRPLYLWTTLLVAISMAGLGAHSYLSTYDSLSSTFEHLRWLPILLIGLLFAGAQLGFSPVIKIIISEVFPTDLRSTGSSLVFLGGSVSIALLSKLFAQFLNWFGFHGTLWFYSGISMVALLYGFYFMPDYSSVSLAGIEKEAAEKLGGGKATSTDKELVVETKLC